MHKLIITVALLAGVPIAAAHADMAAIEAAARKEGAVTWYTAQYGAEIAEEVGRAFTAKYPGITVNVTRTSAQIAFQRLSQDIREGVAQCDVFSSTDLGHDVALKKQNRLAHYDAENEAKLSPLFQGFDKDHTFYPTVAGLVFLAYNSNKVKPDQAPKNWTDLLDPKWKGQIATGHPGFSGTMGTLVVGWHKLYGWEFLDKLEKNKPLIGRSINDTVTMLNSGERAIAAGASGTVIESAARGNPVAVVYPPDGMVLLISPSGILANAPHPNAARLFLEFLLGPEHAEISVRAGREPLRPEVPSGPGVKPLSEIKLIKLTSEEITEGIPEAIERWRDVFGN